MCESATVREIKADVIEDTVYRLFLDANVKLPPDIFCAIEKSAARMPEGKEGNCRICRDMLLKIRDNAAYAGESGLPICQDTGLAVVFAEVGQDVHIVGGSLRESVDNGVRRAYADGLFRKSVVSHPLERKNSGDNTPAVIHTELCPGDKIKISVMPKGFGSENMSALKMFNPSAGESEIAEFAAETVKRAGGKACPPLVVGIGVGGSFEHCALLAKKALLREVGDYNSDPLYANLERLALDEINKTGVGVQGLGCGETAIWAAVEGFATHIAGLPVAINISCHVTRHKCAIL